MVSIFFCLRSLIWSLWSFIHQIECNLAAAILNENLQFNLPTLHYTSTQLQSDCLLLHQLFNWCCTIIIDMNNNLRMSGAMFLMLKKSNDRRQREALEAAFKVRGIHKLRWQARRRGRLAKFQRYYIISLCSKLVNGGEGGQKSSKFRLLQL